MLRNPQLCGETGKRTIFAIKLTQGQARDIARYSFVSEHEVLLPPGCHFKVESVLPQGDLTLIQLCELPSREWIMDLSKTRAVEATVGGGGASDAERIAFLQSKIEQSTQTLRELQAMNVCWTTLQREVCDNHLLQLLLTVVKG